MDAGLSKEIPGVNSMKKVRIRWMCQKDIKPILEIQNSDNFSPKWSREDYLGVLKGRRNPKSLYCISYVCELDKVVVGYMVYHVFALGKELYNSQIGFHPMAPPMCGEVVNFCVHKDFRKQGYGTLLFNFLLDKFSNVVDFSKGNPQSRPFLLQVTTSEKDIVPHLFLSKFGFLAKSISRDLYGTSHDGYNFVYDRLGIDSQNLSCFGERSLA